MWHIQNPPFNLAQMLDEQRSPSWADEYAKALKVADDLTHGEANPVAVAEKVQALFGVTIPPGNRTMAVFVTAILDHLTVRRPTWFDANTGDLLPEVSDPRSLNALQAEEDARIEADRAARRKEKAAQKAAETRAANLAAIEDILVKFPVLKTTAEQLTNKGFDETKAALAGLSDAFTKAGITHEMAGSAFFSCFPDAWVKRLSDGTVKFREAPLKEKPTTLGKKDKAVLRAVYGFIEKYGEEHVRANLLRIFPGSLIKDVSPKEIAVPELVIVDDEDAPTEAQQ